MNPLMLIIIALVALCYCGGKLCPAVLRQNKEMLLGVAIGMALCSFMDLRMEGITNGSRGITESELVNMEGTRGTSLFRRQGDDLTGPTFRTTHRRRGR